MTFQPPENPPSGMQTIVQHIYDSLNRVERAQKSTAVKEAGGGQSSLTATGGGSGGSAGGGGGPAIEAITLDASGGDVTRDLSGATEDLLLVTRIDTSGNTATIAGGNGADIVWPERGTQTTWDLAHKQTIFLSWTGSKWYVEEGRFTQEEKRELARHIVQTRVEIDALDEVAVRRSYQIQAGQNVKTIDPFRTGAKVELVSTPTFDQVSLNNQAGADDKAVRADRTVSVSGTSNRVQVDAGSTTQGKLTQDISITLTAPQDLHTSADFRVGKLRVGTSDSPSNSGGAHMNDTVKHSQFADGWSGNNWRVTEIGEMTAESLFLRGPLTVSELIVNRIHAVDGTQIIGPGRGRIESVSGSAPTETINLEDPNEQGYTSFAAGDLVIVQNVDVDASTIVKRLVREVDSVDNANAQITLRDHSAGPSDTGSFAEGDTIVVIGHISDSARQNVLVATATNQDAPYRRTLSGIDSWTAWQSADKIKTQTGNIAPLVPGSASYGFYGGSVRLEDDIRAGDLSAANDPANKAGDFFKYDANGLTIRVDGVTITTMQGDISTNQSDISTNVSDISTNQNNISSNASDISDNAANITLLAERVAQESEARSGLEIIASETEALARINAEVIGDDSKFSQSTLSLHAQETESRFTASVQYVDNNNDVNSRASISLKAGPGGSDAILAGENIILDGNTEVDGTFTVDDGTAGGWTINQSVIQRTNSDVVVKVGEYVNGFDGFRAIHSTTHDQVRAGTDGAEVQVTAIKDASNYVTMGNDSVLRNGTMGLKIHANGSDIFNTRPSNSFGPNSGYAATIKNLYVQSDTLIEGDAVVDGTLSSDKISANTLEAIQADLGSVTITEGIQMANLGSIIMGENDDRFLLGDFDIDGSGSDTGIAYDSTAEARVENALFPETDSAQWSDTDSGPSGSFAGWQVTVDVPFYQDTQVGSIGDNIDLSTYAKHKVKVEVLDGNGNVVQTVTKTANVLDSVDYGGDTRISFTADPNETCDSLKVYSIYKVKQGKNEEYYEIIDLSNNGNASITYENSRDFVGGQGAIWRQNDNEVFKIDATAKSHGSDPSTSDLRMKSRGGKIVIEDDTGSPKIIIHPQGYIDFEQIVPNGGDIPQPPSGWVRICAESNNTKMARKAGDSSADDF